jgi:opacity protein-like surface antigen
MKALQPSIAMKSATVLAGAGAALLASLSTAHLNAQEHGIYFNADGGPALTEDAKLKENPGAGGGGDVEFDPGVRFSFGGGYRFTEWFSVGGESGVIVNGIDGADAVVTQAPFLANLELRWPNKSRLVPFIGGGPGFSFSGISIDEDNLGGGSNVDGSASDVVFAWQVYGGVRFKLADNMSLGAAYKYFDAGSPTWEVEDSADDIRFGKLRTHAFVASFSMSF